MSALLTPTQARVLRAVHRAGSASVPALMQDMLGTCVTVKGLRSALERLCDYGWLQRLPGRPVPYAVTDAGLDYLIATGGATLPRRPGNPCGAPPPAHPHLGAAKPRPRPATPRHAGLVAQPRTHHHLHTTWAPPRDVPAREGALDHLRYPSHGPTGKGRPC